METELERGEWTGLSTLEAIEEYRQGVAGEGPHANTWADKPHRLVYDLVRIAKTLTRERDESLAALEEAQETIDTIRLNPDDAEDYAEQYINGEKHPRTSVVLAARDARVKVLEAALRGKVRRPYYTGRADGWWTCGECDAIGPEGQIKHRDGCAVAALAPTEEADAIHGVTKGTTEYGK